MSGFTTKQGSSVTACLGRSGYPTSYGTALEILGTRDRRKLGNNTYLKRASTDGPIEVILHRTAVVTYHLDGRIVLNSGGWQTATTRDRWRACGLRVYTEGGVAVLRMSDHSYVYRDGLTIDVHGAVTGHGGTDPAATIRVRRRNLRRNPSAVRCETRMSNRWSDGNVPEATGRA